MNKEQEKEYQIHLTSLDKDTLISLYLQKCYDADIDIADLEAKLAKSEEYNEMLLEEKSGYIDLVSGYSKKCKNYEQQLAEKEKEIAEMHKQLSYCESLLLRECKECDSQAKTDFAIEMLEKVKEKALTFYVNDTPDLTGFYVDTKEIDQQIKELTHQHEDKGE